MAPAPTPPKGKKGGSVLARKVGPLPIFGWVIVAIGLYLGYKVLHGSSASAATPSSTATTGTLGTGTDTSGSTGGASSGSGSGGSDTSGYQGVNDLYEQLLQQLLQNPLPGSGLPGGTTGGTGTGSTGAPGSTGQQVTSNAGPTPVSGKAGTLPPSSGGYTNEPTAFLKRVEATPAPFGGVTSTRVLKNGAVLTTYASGRQVEQVAGHSAYVVHK